MAGRLPGDVQRADRSEAAVGRKQDEPGRLVTQALLVHARKLLHLLGRRRGDDQVGMPPGRARGGPTRRSGTGRPEQARDLGPGRRRAEDCHLRARERSGRGGGRGRGDGGDVARRGVVDCGPVDEQSVVVEEGKRLRDRRLGRPAEDLHDLPHRMRAVEEGQQSG